MKVGRGRYSEALRRLLQIPGEPDQELDEVLQGVFVVQGDAPEFQALKGLRLGWGAQFVAASAGVFSQVQVYNPAGSGSIVVVEEAWLSSAHSSQQYMVLQHGEVALTTNASAAIHRDTRNATNVGGNLGITAELRSGAQALTTGSVVWIMNVKPGEALRVPCNCVLRPGTGLIARFSTLTNFDIAASFRFYERALAPTEQRLV